MSIAFSCQMCGKRYEMSEDLAGKWARCRKCGTEFLVPPPETLPEEDDEFAPPPRTFPKKEKTRAKPRERNEGLFGWGIRFLIFGVGVFVLPFLGLQWKGLHLLGETAQLGIGVAILAIGAVCVTCSRAGAGYILFGFGALIVAGLIFLLVLALDQAPEPPPPVVRHPKVTLPANLPRPANVPQPPNLPRPRRVFRAPPAPTSPPAPVPPPPTFSSPPPASPAPPPPESPAPDNSGFPPPRF